MCCSSFIEIFTKDTVALHDLVGRTKTYKSINDIITIQIKTTQNTFTMYATTLSIVDHYTNETDTYYSNEFSICFSWFLLASHFLCLCLFCLFFLNLSREKIWLIPLSAYLEFWFISFLTGNGLL